MLIPILQHFQVWSYTHSENTGEAHCFKDGFYYYLLAIKPEMEQTEHSTELIA